jgi:hypothetical protein
VPIEVIDTGYVFRNLKPHLRSLQAAFPSVVLLPDGELLCAFGIGSAFESVDAHTVLARSRDGGSSWELQGPLLEEQPQRPSSSNLRVSRMPDGELVAAGARWDRSHADEGLVNPATLGFVPTELILLRSRDAGRTWTGPYDVLPPLAGPSFEVCHALVALPDGRWLWPTSTWRGWDGDAPNGMKAIALVSHDGGATWPGYVDVMDGAARGIVYWEQKLVRFEDSRLLAVCWAHELDAGRDLPVCWAISSDGRSFSAPAPIPLAGQTTTPLPLGGDRVLLVYRRTDRAGLWAVLSRFDGSRWQHDAEALLWGAAATSARSSADGATIAEEMSALRFGLPHLTRLPGQAVLVTFWCVEDCVSVIRWVMLRVAA